MRICPFLLGVMGRTRLYTKARSQQASGLAGCEAHFAHKNQFVLKAHSRLSPVFAISLAVRSHDFVCFPQTTWATPACRRLACRRRVLALLGVMAAHIPMKNPYSPPRDFVSFARTTWVAPTCRFPACRRHVPALAGAPPRVRAVRKPPLLRSSAPAATPSASGSCVPVAGSASSAGG